MPLRTYGGNSAINIFLCFLGPWAISFVGHVAETTATEVLCFCEMWLFVDWLSTKGLKGRWVYGETPKEEQQDAGRDDRARGRKVVSLRGLQCDVGSK